MTVFLSYPGRMGKLPIEMSDDAAEKLVSMLQHSIEASRRMFKEQDEAQPH